LLPQHLMLTSHSLDLMTTSSQMANQLWRSVLPLLFQSRLHWQYFHCSGSQDSLAVVA